MMPYTAADMIRTMQRTYDLAPEPEQRASRSIFRFITAFATRFAR